MGFMKDYDRRIRQGGDDAIAAACELADIAKERRGYEDVKNAQSDITDIVTVLRGVGFAAISPQADESASLLHYCVTHAADEIEQLRQLMPQWIPVDERLPDDGVRVLAWDRREQSLRVAYLDQTWYMVGFDDDTPICVSHWQPLPEPPSL